MLLNLDKYHYIYIFPLNNQRVISGSRRRSSRITWWIAGWDAHSAWPGDGGWTVEPSIYGHAASAVFTVASNTPIFRQTEIAELKAMTWDYIFENPTHDSEESCFCDRLAGIWTGDERALSSCQFYFWDICSFGWFKEKLYKKPRILTNNHWSFYNRHFSLTEIWHLPSMLIRSSAALS